MRKTSYDGADTSSITSDNETKKSTNNFNKMKKSSIKRKVQNFSHESDDGIIEPLLQTDKQKVEIASRSAKYLLNKNKTESLHEKDNNVTDGYADKFSQPKTVSSTSNNTSNVKESSISTSFTCGAAPIHNHMNTNIFSAYDASAGLITTKTPILVEIGTSKSGRYSPSPLIFTTAKIHTDSKTKLMEPVQVTSVPILSTIEGNIVKAGVVSNVETITMNLSKNSPDIMKVLSEKPEINIIQTSKDKILSPTVPLNLPKSEILHSKENVKTESNAINSIEVSTNLLYKDEKLQLLNTVRKPNLASNNTTTLKEQPMDAMPTHKNILTKSDSKLTEIQKSTSSSKNTLDKCSLVDKSNDSFCALDNKDNTILPKDIQNQESKHKTNLMSLDDKKTNLISKDTELTIHTSVSGNKKLQRQKNALTEATNESVSKNLITHTQSHGKEAEKDFNIKTDKAVIAIAKVDNKSDSADGITLPIDKTIISTSHQPMGICVTTSSLKQIKSTPSTVSASTSKVKSGAITGAVNIKPTVTCVSNDVPKSFSKSSIVTPQADVKVSKVTTTTSIMLTSTGPTNSKLSAIPVSVKPDILPSSTCVSQSVKTDASTTSPATTITTTLPSYIVSTSKTKIGSTLTSTTPASTSKPLIQKPLVGGNATSAHLKTIITSGSKPAPSSSATNGAKHTILSKPTKSKADTVKKDGRALH